jgi:hypothetical protein
MGRALDLTGQRFGELTVINRTGTKNGYAVWRCQCSCDAEVEVRSNDLKKGKQQSCGCLRSKNLVERNAKHGGKEAASLEYRAWKSLGCRSARPKEWNDFVQFFCDVGERPSPNHHLQRKDRTQPHSSTNTYWRNADEYKDLTATDLGSDFVLDLRAFALAEAAARTREASA